MTNKIPHVAILIETSKAFGRNLLRGVARYLSHCGPWVTWIEERSLDDPLPRWLQRWKGDGILARTRTHKTLKRILDLGIPMVNLGEEPLEGVPIVDIDSAKIGRLAAEHLLERGFRHFGYVGIRGVCWSDRRKDAFVQRVEAAGATCSVCEPTSRLRLHSDWETERQKLADWLQSLPRPVGIMACYDVMGCRLLGVCRELGLAVPEEVAVIGVDNDQVLCEVAAPPISSIDQG
ncbi:MAG TPA: XylR family transcriptional regulator, partial [Thermoguttaceae bacterium]|nr:XylR family transcriptional regulator [Thermoguttaceae bacterium]